MAALAMVRCTQRDGEGTRFQQIIGNSAALESVLEQAQLVGPTDSTVLILGETGTGKELIARAVHSISPRCGRPFVKLSCAAIPAELLESELFGHERGAFTGAVTQRLGRFEAANGGTLFLDEIGDMPPGCKPLRSGAREESATHASPPLDPDTGRLSTTNCQPGNRWQTPWLPKRPSPESNCTFRCGEDPRLPVPREPSRRTVFLASVPPNWRGRTGRFHRARQPGWQSVLPGVGSAVSIRTQALP
jgi:hypothetical protein